MLKRVCKTVFRIRDLKCTFCPKLLEKFLLELPGIYKVRVSFAKKSLFVVYDSSIGDISLLISTIREIGFTAIFMHNFVPSYAS